MRPGLAFVIWAGIQVILTAPLRAQTAGWDIVIAHLAVGGGYSSNLEISDPVGIGAVPIEVSFFDDAGAPLAVRVDGAPPSGSVRLSLSRFEARTLTLASDADSPRTGWVRIACDRGTKVYASLRFLRALDSTTVTDAVGVLPSGVQRTWYTIVSRLTADDYTGIAVANPNTFPLDVEFNLYQGPIRLPGTTSERRTLAPMGHLGIFVHQLFPVNFSGTATLEVYGTQGQVAVASLHAIGAQYSALPAHPAVETWEFTVTDERGATLENGNWCWKYNESTGFHGVASSGALRFDFRGSFNGRRFELVRFGPDGGPTGVDLVLYQGVLKALGDLVVVRGRRLDIGENGDVLRTSDFSATRLQ